MSVLDIRPRSECRWDEVSLGEIMLRLDPSEGRVRTTRGFRVWEGGGEYNVARGLRRCFGMTTAVATAFVDNEVGRLLEDLMLQGGVDTSLVQWREFDGIGRNGRNGLNFTERGFGIRGAIGCSDRGNTAASQLMPGDFDWDAIFGRQGARWLHTGGIFAALSPTTADLVIEAVQAAKKHGTIVSYDLNYRASLWDANGGSKRAQEVNREIAKYVDVMIGNEEDFTACLGFEVEGVDDNLTHLDVASFRNMINQAVATYPNFKATGTTLRAVKSATVNDWGAICWVNGDFYEATHRADLEILDRVGGGDSFASGFIYGLMALDDPQAAVEYGAAHGALAMTTAGDTSMASLKEVQKLVKGGGPASSGNMNEQLLLSSIRSVLIRLEDTIIFALIERAQFSQNLVIYDRDAFSTATGGRGIMGFLLHETEHSHARMRRYTSPDEHPFYDDLPLPILPELRYDENPLHPNTINVNDRLRNVYETEIIQTLCAPGDDQQYGSSSVCDVACLQALSKRVHYGTFVAESKFQADTERYRSLIAASDGAGIMAALTDSAVEEQVLKRVTAKAAAYQGDVQANASAGFHLQPRQITDVYRKWIIPMTKHVELAYLMARLRTLDT